MVVREGATVVRRFGPDALWVLSCLALSAMTLVSMKGISEDLAQWHIVYAWLTISLGVLSLLSALFWKPELSPLDLLFLLLLLSKGISVWTHHNGFSVSWTESLADAVVYFSLRQMLSVSLPARFEQWSRRLSSVGSVEGLLLLLLLAAAVPTVSECLCGTFQLLGLSHSHHSLFNMTGSFFNPGPYGGWLMLGVTVFGMAFLKSSSWLRYIYMVLAVWALLLLPFTLSRAAFLGAVMALSLGAACHFEGYARWLEALRRNRIRTLFKTMTVLLIGCLVCAGAYIVKKPSADGRMFVNRMSLMMMSQHPVLGCGPGQFAGEYGHTQEVFSANAFLNRHWTLGTWRIAGK